MAEVQLKEAATYPAEAYIESYFADRPTDERFQTVSLHKFMPTKSVDGAELEFLLDKFEGPNIYQIQVLYI